MAKEETGTTQKMMEYPARLQMSMLAPVKKMAELIADGDKEVRIVGYVFGEARGVSYRNNPNSADGSAAEALIGAFEGVPAYEDMEGLPPCSERAGLRSGVLFLPPSAQASVVAAVRGNDPDSIPVEAPKRGQRIDKLGISVPITVEIGIRKSNSPVGYEWVTRGLANVSQESPLDRMRAMLGADLGKRVDQIEKADAKALASPTKTARAKKSARRK